MNGKKTALPFRVLAALCAFLLTACLAGIAGSLLLRQAATDTGLRGEAAVSPAVLKSQRAEIYRRMEELGEKYGISAEKLSGGIGEESLKAFDLEAAAWRVSLTDTGKWTEPPVYDASALRDTILQDAGFLARFDEYEQARQAENLIIEAGRRITDSALSLRKTVLQKGFSIMQQRVDLSALLSAFKKLPLLLAAAALVLGALTALLAGRRLSASGAYLGAAAGGAGLLILLAAVLAGRLGIADMLREASGTMAERYAFAAGTIRTEAFIAAGALMLLSVLLILWSGRGNRRKGTVGRHERKA